VIRTADLSDQFFKDLPAVASTLGVSLEHLLEVMNFESGVYASAQNATTGATGLIQFMPATLRGMGYTKGYSEFRKLRAEEQLPYVKRYLSPYAGKMTSLEAAYLAVFLPAYIPQASDPDFILARATSIIAKSNPALRGPDGSIQVKNLAPAIKRQQKSARWLEILYRAGLFTGPLP